MVIGTINLKYMESKIWKLAIDGGPKAKTTPNIPMYPGGYEIGELEKQAVIEVIEDKYLFRYYGPAKYRIQGKEI